MKNLCEKKLNETLTDKREPIKILCEKVKLNVDKSYGFDIAATAVVAGWPGCSFTETTSFAEIKQRTQNYINNTKRGK